MAKISCFSTLLAGRRQKQVVADTAKSGGGGERPRPRVEESINATRADVVYKCGDKIGPRDVKIISSDMAVVVAHKGGDTDTSPVKKRGTLCDDLGEPRGCGTEEDAEVDPSAKLKRSCSNIETKRSGPVGLGMPARSRSYGDLMVKDTIILRGVPGPEASPAVSVKTADRVMLKRRSSSQVLPSRSRKLWWRLFLWSHRNLHRSDAAAPGCGYTSDTLQEPDRKNKKEMSPPPPPPVPNQWVAFCADSCLTDRVSAWVSSIDHDCLHQGMEHGDCVAGAGEPSPPSARTDHGKSKRCAAAHEVAQANSIVQSLSAFSSVAHISGMGIKAMPIIAPFSTLRAVNLSSNFIVHISSGSLPKGLHSLDLSRNKIANVEGLRELTKLRLLNLSYNRISRIGHGLSNCTAMRELYVAGNKISYVEGLHRLLKLAVLDLGFNKLTTTKALGQLVAHYQSLLALNLVGNPVQTNVGDDALRKAVTGLLPQLAYLNKQPVKPQRAREVVATDSVARAALGGGRRRASRRLSQSPGSRSRSKGRQQNGSSQLTARK